MTQPKVRSVHDRLLNVARSRGEAFNRLLIRYALERFLYRLSISPVKNRFCLKGAMLFDIWFDTPHRPTRDIDLLGLGPGDTDSLRSAIKAVCDGQCPEDGMRFDSTTIEIKAIRESATYAGLRVRLSAYLGRARCPVQIDVGFGDAVTPAAIEQTYPALLEAMPAPKLACYPPTTAMAEKLEAIVSLGMANSRMKDYFDLLMLMDKVSAAQLATAMEATFQRRGTAMPKQMPVGLSDDFATDALKQQQWQAFLDKNGLDAPNLKSVVTRIRENIAATLVSREN